MKKVLREIDTKDVDLGVVELPPERFRFDDGMLEEMDVLLGITDPETAAAIYLELEEIANDYRRWITQTAASPSRSESTDQLKKVAAEAGRLSVLLRSLDEDALFAVMRHLDVMASVQNSPEQPGRLPALCKELDELSRFARASAKRMGKERGPRKNNDMMLAVHQLAEMFERITGERVTHTAGIEGIYDGKPRSRAGRFIRIFFKAVHPALGDQSVSTVLSEFIEKRNRRAAASQEVPQVIPARIRR